MEATEIAAMLFGECPHQSGDFLDHRIVDLARHDSTTVTLRECDDPDRQRRPPDDIGLRRSAMDAVRPVQPDHLGGATADVEEDDAGRGRIEQLGAAGSGQSGLSRRIHDLKLEAGFVGDAGAEFTAVLGGAAGLGGDQPRAMDATRTHFIAADQKRLDGALDRRLADPP